MKHEELGKTMIDVPNDRPGDDVTFVTSDELKERIADLPDGQVDVNATFDAADPEVTFTGRLLPGDAGVAPELEALDVCRRVLEPLQYEARRRALAWLADRFEVEP